MSAEMKLDTPDIIEYVAQYGGRCRDCADEDGICPSSGLACDTHLERKAIAHVLRAVSYGINRGYVSTVLSASQPSRDAVIEVDEAAERIWQAEWTRGGGSGRRRVAWSDLGENTRESYRVLARAALKSPADQEKSDV